MGRQKGSIPWNKGLKTGALSEEHKKKLSDAGIGRKFTEEHKEKIGKGNKGKKLSEETKKKMSISKIKFHKEHPDFQRGKNSPLFGKNLSEEHKQKIKERGKRRFQDPKEREKISIANKGKPKSEEHKQKMRKPKSEEHKQKIKESNMEFYKKHPNIHKGENNPMWNPNREKVYAPYGENCYDKKLKKEKWNLQNGRDMLTGTKLDRKKTPAYHHIDYDKSNDDSNNHCFVSHSNHARITGYQSNPIKSERYKKILQENTLALKKGVIPKYWSQINKELFRQEKLKQLDLSSYII